MSNLKIAVVGAGANGGSVAADLTRAGLDVTLIEQWPEHVAAMRANGLRVLMPDADETTLVKAFNFCDLATFRVQFDVVLVLMKAYDTRMACELIMPVLKDDGIVVGMQNGMTIDDMADIIGLERTVGCVIEVASTMFEPGLIQRDTTRADSWFALGDLAPGSGRAAAAADLLRHCGTVQLSDDIRSSKWMKLIANSTELVTSAILNTTVMDAVTHPGMQDVMIEAGNEAARTAVELGHQLMPILGMKASDITGPDTFAEQLLAIVHDKFSIPGQKTTVLQDWIKGRRSEVNEINGRVVAEQKRLGGKAPVNEAITRIAQLIEHGKLEAGLHNIDGLVAARALA
jgi:2-dehydropantoate 2-reductase